MVNNFELDLVMAELCIVMDFSALCPMMSDLWNEARLNEIDPRSGL